MVAPHDLVCIVDDDASVRAALESLLRSVGLAVRAFASAPDFLNFIETNTAGCAVLDVRMPGSSGLDCQRQLIGARVDIPLIFVTAHGDIPMSVCAIKAGAVDFLTKPFRDQDLLDAVHEALERDRNQRSVGAEMSVLRGRFASLTPREQEVMMRVVSGRPNKQTASELGTSEVTVKVHRSQVMRKMQADSFAELVRMASRLEVPARR
jgi:FixJ family two-component response regulator